jgi:hypothetical protein
MQWGESEEDFNPIAIVGVVRIAPVFHRQDNLYHLISSALDVFDLTLGHQIVVA